jgi:hypothetical protein
MFIRHLMNFFTITGMLFLASSAVGYEPAKDPSRECWVGLVNVNAEKVAIKRIVKVDMVALNQAFWYNRLGASQLTGMIYALASDVVLTSDVLNTDPRPITENPDWMSKNYGALIGKVSLRPDKRPRPIVLRANVKDCLDIQFTNLLETTKSQVTNELTSYAGVHIEGTEVFSTTPENIKAIENDGAFIGRNTINLAAPGERKNYSLYVPAEGAFVLYSAADDFSNFLQGQMTLGLFGSLNVQPLGAEYYRSQVTAEQLTAATKKDSYGKPRYAVTGQPLIHYQADDGNGKPILNMLKQLAPNTFELVHTDSTAIITGPGAGAFPAQPLQQVFNKSKQYPDRFQPYREFNIMYHEPVRAEQAFEQFDTAGSFPAKTTFAAGGDFFAINYGMGGIGPEILSNRLGVGPMNKCVTCAYEEFFLSSWAVGDPAMVVDVPANFNGDSTPNPLTVGTEFPTNTTNSNGFPQQNPPLSPPTLGPKAKKAFYPDDPSNVYHSYMSDHVKMRIHHGAGTLHHLHHLHAHQWLHSPKSDNGHYLDSQLIGPGSSFTLDMVYNGSGNRNQTVGDSIFHCHFYPHFAEGMWSLWRVHDVFEAGTKLVAKNGTKDRPIGAPAEGSRALPDGEIIAGTPIPGLVPLPTIAMAPVPSDVFIDNGQVVFGTPESPDPSGTNVTVNPGYPFFIPGIAGERAPHPPMDFAEIDGKHLDGGLPRHVVNPSNKIWDPNGKDYDPEIVEYHNRFDFSKFHNVLEGKILLEGGTPVEKVAMQTHSKRTRPSFTPENDPKKFVLNGLPPQKGAPYADPCSTYSSSQFLDTPTPISAEKTRYYRAVDMQMDVILNKKGWHYSQQRFGVLWEDLIPTLNKERPPEPLFFRANSTECIEYWLANVIPEYYELDDFQVRTPTDVLGQHIHLVKFDVTSSDGSANGWNYEDGTFAPEAVKARLKAFKNGSSLEGYTGDFKAVAPTWLCENLSPSHKADCEQRANSEWLGTQATVQRWYADPQLNNMGKDRTLRTVFTHDHFSPSTHQQAGLYMGLLVEPEDSTWRDSETGALFGTRADGGPTSWQAVIATPNFDDTYREFMLEFQDFALAYQYQEDPPDAAYPHANENCYYQNAPCTIADSKANYDSNLEPVLNQISTPTGSNQVGCSSSTADKLYVDAVSSCTNNYSGYLAPFDVINPPQGQGGDQSVKTRLAITPTLISTTPPFALGTYSVNYRNEPLPFRVWDPTSNLQASGLEGDLAHVYRSIERADPQLNGQQPQGASPNPLTAGVYPDDPYTPLLRAYQGDKVQVRTLVGAHINMHNFSMQGLRWFFEPSNTRSGYRSNQPMGISEHFEMNFTIPTSTVSGMSLTDSGDPTQLTAPDCEYRQPNEVTFADYLYNPSSEENGLLNGNWGLLRAYQQGRQDLCLQALPSNDNLNPINTEAAAVCPVDSPKREYNVVTVTAAQLPDKKVIYNSAGRERIYDDEALLYFGCDATADPSCSVEQLMDNLKNLPQTPSEHIEPFVLRAAAGECITVNLTNRFNVKSGGSFPDAKTINNQQEQNAMLQFRYLTDDCSSAPGGKWLCDAKIEKNCTSAPNAKWLCDVEIADVCASAEHDKFLCDMKLAPSQQVALAPQLVSYDINQSNGINLGFNSVQTAKVNATQKYTWYAGISGAGAAEFGSANLLTADPVAQTRYGMLAGMVIEPEGSCWSSQNGKNTTCDGTAPTKGVIASSSSSSITGSQVTVHNADGSYFQEFVVIASDSLAASQFTNTINYGVERMEGRDTGLSLNSDDPPPAEGRGRYTYILANGPNLGKLDAFQLDMACAYSNALGNPYGNPPVGTALGEPETPIFRANPGDAVRFRVMQSGGADQHTFELFGHVWQEEPYNLGSTVITNNPNSQWQGSRMGLSAADRFDIVLASAGGSFAIPGDYLYRSFPGGDQAYGMWGIFRVGNQEPAYSDATGRPLVCVPQRNSKHVNDAQYIYSNKIFSGYELPAGCNLSSTTPSVTCP